MKRTGIAAAALAAVVATPAATASAASGDLDPTFGVGGIVITAIGSSVDGARALVLQPDGKLVAAGESVGATYDFALVRYNPDGTLDSSFGTGGKVTTAVGSQIDQAWALVLQPDGKLVAAGGATFGGLGFEDFALVRYNADGTLDSSFGTGGKVVTVLLSLANDGARALLIQPDGKLVAAGYVQSGLSPTSKFALVRYNPDGTLDGSFGIGGVVTTSILTDAGVGAVILQPDGKIIAAGVATSDIALARYNTDGTLDGSFGIGGKVTTPVGAGLDVANAIVIQPDGKPVVAGTSNGVNDDFVLVRYNADGTLDGTFGTGGIVTTPIGSAADRANGLVLQPDGKLVAAGVAGATIDFALVRYNADGTLDSSFGAGGKVTTPIGLATDEARALALQVDGKLVAAGHTAVGGSTQFALARYDGVEIPTPTFTETATPTNTPVSTATEAPTQTATFTDTPTETPIPTPTATDEPTPTPIPSETPTPSTTATATGTVTPVIGCPLVARSGCRTALKSLVLIKSSGASTDKLLWKWIRGQATSQQELGDPQFSADYALCLYAGAAQTLIAGGEVLIPANGTKWIAIGTKGWKYKDTGGTAADVQKVLLKGSDQDKAKLLLKGKGTNLPDPALPIANPDLPVIVQLANTDTEPLCWESVFQTADVIKNELGQFKAKAQ